MKQMPLGIPLAIALAGTVGSLAFGAKKVHVLFGAALTGLSLWHMYQHRKVMLRQMQMAKPALADRLQAAVALSHVARGELIHLL